ncbi:MAG: hypothetical protein Q9168_002333, partial [Polycauliona sp. 1 TL-2023]
MADSVAGLDLWMEPDDAQRFAMADSVAELDLWMELDDTQRFAKARETITRNNVLAAGLDQVISKKLQALTRFFSPGGSSTSTIPIYTGQESLILGKIVRLRATLMGFGFDHAVLDEWAEAVISTVGQFCGPKPK